MFYVLVIVIAAFATAAMTKEFPQTRTHIGVVSLGAAVIAVIIAEVTGNLLAFYLGSLAVAYGLLMLLARVVAGLRNGGGGLYQDK